MDRTVIFKQEETSGHEPQSGLDTKADKLTDRQLQCDSESDTNITGNIKGLNLAAVRHTTFQVIRLPLWQNLLKVLRNLLY
jgi:hypothetical protein